MWKSIKRAWAYLGAMFGAKVEEKADPKIQLEQAIEEAKKRHQELSEQAATVLGNERQAELKLNRTLEEVERMQGSAKQALIKADAARAAGNEAEAKQFEDAAQAFAMKLVADENTAREQKQLLEQAEAASVGARKAVEQNAMTLQKTLAERSKLLSQLENAKMQERMNAALKQMDELSPKGDVPTVGAGPREDRGPVREGAGRGRSAVRLRELEDGRGGAGTAGQRGGRTSGVDPRVARRRHHQRWHVDDRGGNARGGARHARRHLVLRMRLVRFRHSDRIATGAVATGDEVVRVLRGTFFEDPLPTGEEIPLDDVRLLAPVLPSKLVCVGKNYAAHAAEFGLEVPDEPLLFLKPSTAVIGPHEPIQLLPISRRVDYEGEMAVVIGALARNVRSEDAYQVILGYTCANDVTLRDLQHTDDQWARAKGFDGSCPLGPWVETDVDPNDVRVETRLNGEVRQGAQTSDMVFGVATLIEYITAFMTLLPGDVILTGTPEGVGKLSPGDVVEVEVEGVGTLANTVAG